MVLDILSEEPSARALLHHVVPKITGDRLSGLNVRTFRGKQDLLKRLEDRLRGYGRWEGGPRVIVLVDRDQDDCRRLKDELERSAERARLISLTQSRRSGERPVLANRIVVPELEAWLLGDFEALHSAFPRVPSTLASKQRFRNPDAIRGGAARALEQLLRRHGHLQDRQPLPKISVAEQIGVHMNPALNRSESFRAFCGAVDELVSA